MMRLRDTSLLMESSESKAYEPVHMAGVIPILAILCGGFILSIIALLIEKIYYYYYLKRKLQSKIFYYSKKQLFIKKR